MTPYLRSVLVHLAWNLPNLAVYGVGIGICLRDRTRNPDLAKWFVTAFVLFAVSAVLFPFNRAWMVMHAETPILNKAQIGILYGVTSSLLGVVHYAGWGVLLFAIYRTFKKGVAGSHS